MGAVAALTLRYPFTYAEGSRRVAGVHYVAALQLPDNAWLQRIDHSSYWATITALTCRLIMTVSTALRAENDVRTWSLRLPA